MVIDLPGWSASAIRAAGAEWTVREIFQQPVLWPELSKQVATDAQLRSYLAPLLADPALRIVCTGAGTSAYVGECLAPALARAGRRVEAIATTDIVSSPRSAFAPEVRTLVVHFARSGNSPESVAALELAEQLIEGCEHLVVTCNAEGSLARRAQGLRSAHSIVLPDDCNDRGFAMTSSFTGMLLTAAQALGAVRPMPERIENLAAVGGELLSRLLPQVAALAQTGFDRVVFLGSNELKGVARESALKMLELTDGRVVSVAETPLGFRHGPKTIVNENTLVVFLLSNDLYTRQYDTDLLREIRKDGQAGRVIAITNQMTDGAVEDSLEMRSIPAGGEPLADVELCLPYAMFAQLLALHRSLALGLSPDSPNAAGTVSRVVRGVTIHPYPLGGRT